jgi:hypothetical protein
MPSTYHLHERYGFISPSESGIISYAPVKNGLGITVAQGVTNQVYNFDATADYSTFSATGLTGYYDPYFGMVGVGCPKYTIDGTTLSPTIKFPSSNYFQTSADTYKTGSLYIWSEYALQFRLDMQLRNDSDSQVGGVDSSSVITLTPFKWNKIVTTTSANSTKVLMTLNLMNIAAADFGKKFWIDMVQIENNRFATSAYNDIVRSGGSCIYTVPNYGADYTVTGWTEIGSQCSATAGGSHPFFTLYKTNTSYATARYMEGSTKVYAFKDDTDPNTEVNVNGVDYNPGDLVFFALVHNAGTFKMYTAKSGGTLSSAEANTEWEGFDRIYLGSDPVNGLFANAPTEQFLFWDEALTDAEIATVFGSANAYDFTSDKRIVLSAATPTTQGTSKALAISGTGYYRYLDRTVSLDLVALNGPAGTISPTTGFSSASHIFYGADTDKLFLNGIISTGTNMATATLYRVLGLIDTPSVGLTAYAVKI